MLRTTAQIQGAHVLALDGEIGRVVDVYFEDWHWIVRYFVVDTGNWLTGRKVLISPHAVKRIDARLHTVSVELTCERVRGSPDIDTDKPVSRQHEAEYFSYYGYPPYWYFWHSPTYWAAGGVPPQANITNSDLIELQERRIADEREHEREHGKQPDFHLRSSNAVSKYWVRAGDDDIGHVRDFVFDDATWAVRYLVVNTGTWLSGRSVLIGAESIQDVDWAACAVRIGHSREQIVNGPEFDPDHLPGES